MLCHEVDYEIFGDDMQIVEVELDPNETVIAEAGAMNYMEDGITFEAKMGDGSRPSGGMMDALFNVGKRVLTGESIFMTHFHNQGQGKKRVAFAAPYPGKIIPIDMAQMGGELICQKDAFLCAAFGTQLAAFAPVLNNHLFAAAAAAVACNAWLRLLASDEEDFRLSLRAGLAAGFATACELPALSLVALIGLSLLLKRPAETLRGYAVGFAVVAVAFFGTNYWAHNSLRPPYAHRSETDPADNWYDYEYTVGGKTRDSYWRNRQGIDVGEASKATYALHSLVGHHGVFSLTPVWLLSLLGGVRLLASRDGATRQLALVTALITAACLVFYLGMRPQGDRNYGGATSGFRWLFWLAPLWLAMLPGAVDWLKRSRAGFALAAALLAWSAMSASYPTWNPWTHPWVYRWMEWLGFTVL